MNKSEKQVKKGIKTKLQILAALVFIGFFALIIYAQLIDINAYEAEKVELSNKIEEQKKIAVKLDDAENYVNSDEYKEKIARERLGLVKNNDILFIIE